MKEYLEGRNLITKLQAKHDLLQKTLGESEWGSAAGGQQARRARRTGLLSLRPCQAGPTLLHDCISFPHLFDVDAYSPDACLSNGERPVLSTTLRTSYCLWSKPAHHRAPLLCHH